MSATLSISSFSNFLIITNILHNYVLYAFLFYPFYHKLTINHQFFSISRSEYLRKLLLEKQINHQIEVVADMEVLRKLVSEYGKIGSNLNQIAKHFNSGGSQSRAVENEIHQCITDLFQLRKEVLKLAGGMNGNRKTH